MSNTSPDKANPVDSSTATATKAKPAKAKNKPRTLPPYHVVLMNDDDHTYEYVMEMLQSIFGHPQEMGFKLAQEVDEQGRAVVLTTHKEKAELKRDQIHAYGADHRIPCCAGSMTAMIVQAPS